MMLRPILRPIIPVLAAVAVFAIGAAPNFTTAQPAGSGPEIADPETSDQPIFIMPRSGPFAPETVAVPNARVIAAWARSGHSNNEEEAFSHWNEEGEIPVACATCHSGIGFRSYHGLDGSPKGVEAPVPTGGVVDCDTCHNAGLSQITEISLPSGVMHPVKSSDASCLTCHQGRAAGITVEKAVAGKPDDEVDGELRFINPHYRIAGATNLGSYGGGGFAYPGKEYSGLFLHAKPVETCVSCHDPHSLDIAEATCLTCHESGDAANIRIQRVSFDGSGDTRKGIKADIAANAGLLMDLMQQYASEIAGTAMVYDAEHHPYFYADANGDGVADTGEEGSVDYNTWTPRLLRATYNWKFVTADPGVHVHNAPYALELLYDSIADLADPLGVDMDKFGLLR